jgi:hypothetical protein
VLNLLKYGARKDPPRKAYPIGAISCRQRIIRSGGRVGELLKSSFAK